MDKNGLGIGVIGGIGLGLLLGSEFSGHKIQYCLQLDSLCQTIKP